MPIYILSAVLYEIGVLSPKQQDTSLTADLVKVSRFHTKRPRVCKSACFHMSQKVTFFLNDVIFNWPQLFVTAL